MKNLHKKQLRLSRRGFWLVCALLVCLRLALTGFQQAYTWVGGAPLDDELMFRAAQNITAGEWLGAYDYLTYLVAGAALWCGAALLAAFAFSPLWRKKRPEQGRVLTLALFAALAFLPSSWAAYTLRVYRDNIFPALCLYFFAGMAGMAAATSTARTRDCSCCPLPRRPPSLWRWCWWASAAGKPLPRRSSPTLCSASVC